MRYAKRLLVLVLFVPALIASLFLQSILVYFLRGRRASYEELWIDRLLEWAER